jgi:predicted TIM-barrel fold metal-dependent hydrolase
MKRSYQVSSHRLKSCEAAIVRTEWNRIFMRRLLIALAFVPAFAPAQGTAPYRGPIIDVHLHAETTERLTPSAPNPATGQMSPATGDEHMARSLAIMEERNVVLGMVSGPTVADVERWDEAAPDRILKGISVDDPSTFMKPEELDRLFREKRLDAFGEVAAQYAGYSPSDPAFDPYWAIAAKHGVPVGIHTGGAPPGTPYTCCPKFRLKLGTMYRHVYVDISTLTWTPIAGDLLEPFLQEAKRRRMLDRVMFGSDQMRWPEAIALAIDRVNRLGFLTLEEKQDIFYDNAATFLGLSAEEVARHHR